VIVKAERHRRAAPLLTALAVLLALGACQDAADRDDAPTPPAAGGQPVPEQKFYEYRLIETQAGVRQWVLDSDEMLKYPDRRDVELVRVHMEFFREGEYYSTLVSDSGTADLESRDVFVWGNVVVTTVDGRRLRTSELAYSNSDGLIRNEVYNVFDRGEDVVTGIGLEATPDLDYIEIKQDVAAEVGDETASEADAGGEKP
jgi:LPS export ABC transporter protein LptC